jgi:hypothetical protein
MVPPLDGGVTGDVLGTGGPVLPRHGGRRGRVTAVRARVGGTAHGGFRWRPVGLRLRLIGIA